MPSWQDPITFYAFAATTHRARQRAATSAIPARDVEPLFSAQITSAIHEDVGLAINAGRPRAERPGASRDPGI